MIPLPAWQGKHIAVFGLGKTGKAAVAALRASGADVFAWDDGDKAREAVACTPTDDWPWERLDALLLSPGVPLTFPEPHAIVRQAHKHQVRITSDVELLLEALPDKTFAGITGTNGKSTTTALCGHILQSCGVNAQVGGNIGTPVLAMSADADVYVLELSSYQLDLLHNAHFDVGAWLNISPDHLDRHGDMDGYIAAKKHLFSGQGAKDVAVVGVDDAYSEAVCRELLAQAKQKVIPASVTQTVGKGVYVKDGTLFDHGEAIADLTQCKNLQGVHNHQNAAVAFALCQALGAQAESIAGAFNSYPGLAHRMQIVMEKNGVLFVNDSKATNADAAARSLETYDKIHWIAGGVAKEGGIESLAHYFPKITHAYLIGQAQDAFAETLNGHVVSSHCETLKNAVNEAMQTAQAGEVVLLAPACASFDQFANFEIRGDAFAVLVRGN